MKHTLPQRFCVGTFWTRQHVIPALRKKRSELRLRRRVKPGFFWLCQLAGFVLATHVFFALHTRMVWGYRTRLTAPKARAIHWLASQFVVAPFIRLKCVTFMFLHRQHPMEGWLAHSRDAHTQRHGTSCCKAEPLSSEALLPGLPLTIADKRRPLGLVLLIRVLIYAHTRTSSGNS